MVKAFITKLYSALSKIVVYSRSALSEIFQHIIHNNISTVWGKYFIRNYKILKKIKESIVKFSAMKGVICHKVIIMEFWAILILWDKKVVHKN
jgi:hypothetical protein